jgi:hypothetical protein
MNPLRKYADEHGFRAGDDAPWAYEQAVKRFAATGDRSALMRGLLALGVGLGHVRWHLARPGASMGCVY